MSVPFSIVLSHFFSEQIFPAAHGVLCTAPFYKDCVRLHLTLLSSSVSLSLLSLLLLHAALLILLLPSFYYHATCFSPSTDLPKILVPFGSAPYMSALYVLGGEARMCVASVGMFVRGMKGVILEKEVPGRGVLPRDMAEGEYEGRAIARVR